MSGTAEGESRDPEFWDAVEAAFTAVLEAADGARTAALDRHCAGRPAVRVEVEALLVAHAAAGEFIAPEGSPRPGDEPAAPGSHIGPFRLVERIAEGGMGTVYRAERAAGDFRQDVAVKLITSTLYDAETLRRFRAERQILASLQHPNVVTLLDGGVTAAGHPYIAMELLEGLPITDHCRRGELSLHSRLGLFRQLCQAVGFVHRHLVVHRDLKPHNVLVTAQGTVKVLDFGLAKLLDAEVRAARATRMLVGPLTPDYASPEQIRGAPVTTACDVYALGVMLFELLTGRRPYETAGKAIAEMVDLVLYAPAPPPSTVEAGAVPYPPRSLRGDLDAIVLRAMAKEPEERYASAEELGDEVQRYLDGQPVVARAPSAYYVATKTLARHKRAFAAAALLLLVLVGTAVEALRQARVAARERERAEHRFAQTQTLAYDVIFKVHDAIVGLPGAIPARQLLVDQARAHLQDLARDPGAGDELRIKVAEAYRELGTLQGYPGIANLGDTPGALLSYERGLELLTPLLARPEPPLAALYEGSTLEARRSHTLAAQPGRRPDAEAAARRALQAAERMSPREPESDRTLRALADARIMLAYAAHPSQTEAHWRAARDYHARLLARDPADPDRMLMAALMETNLAAHLESQLDREGARPHHFRARELYGELLRSGGHVRHGEDARSTMLSNFGVAGVQLGEDLDGARRALEESQAMRERIAAADPTNANARPRVANGHVELSRALEALGDERAALAHARSAVAGFEASQPEPKLFGALAEAHLRVVRLGRGRQPREACLSARRSVAIFDRMAQDGPLVPYRRRQAEEARGLASDCPTP